MDDSPSSERSQDSVMAQTTSPPVEAETARSRLDPETIQTLDTIENELQFLLDDLTMVSLWAHSLYNAFVVQGTASLPALPLPQPTVGIDVLLAPTNTRQASASNAGVRRRASRGRGRGRARARRTFDMNSELLLAYDDIVLQLRLLEQKMDDLEQMFLQLIQRDP